MSIKYLDKIYTFLVIYKECSFSKASKILGISQPAVTQQIKFIEDYLDTKIVDRKKDMILVSGFNVYPNEVEEILTRHEGILEAAVIGIQDEKSGEAVKAFIVKKDPNLTEEDVRAFAKENLTNYKRPKYIEFVKELPKSNVGKILRRKLREMELQKNK